MLTSKQREAANELLRSRPPVLPGTRAIIDDYQRRAFFDRVVDVMVEQRIEGREDINTFCDLAGVAD